MPTTRETFDAYLATLPARYQDEHLARKAAAIKRGEPADRAHRAAYMAMGIASVASPSGTVRWDEFDETAVVRVPAGQPGGGQFGSGSGAAHDTSSAGSAATSRPAAVARATHHQVKAPTPDLPPHIARATSPAVAKRLAAVKAALREPAPPHQPMPAPGSKPSDYKAPNTEAKYKIGPGDDDWDPARTAEVHVAHMAERLRGVAKAKGPVTVHMTGGGAASGKSTALLEQPIVGMPVHGDAAHINADLAKEAIPEYRDGIAAGDGGAAGATHEESSYMAKATTGVALASGHDVVYDAVGDNGIASVIKNVQRFRDQGAERVTANYATINPDVALQRAIKRAAGNGRVVPEKVFRDAHADVNATAWAAGQRDVFDAITVWDSDVPKGDPPIKVWSKVKGSPVEIHDANLFAKFRDRAGLPRTDSKRSRVLTIPRMYEIIIAHCSGKSPDGYTDEERAFLAESIAQLEKARETNPAAHFWLPAE